jgi:hypothetical protein
VVKAVDQAMLDVATASAKVQGETLAGPFAPGIPLTPFDGVSGLPRAWNFPTGYNIKSRADRDGRIDFQLLKALTDTYDVASMCINHRIDDVRSLSWSVRSADWVELDNPAEIAAANKALRRPDGVTPFRSWVAMYLQDVLRYDAGCLYRRRNMIGQVCALEVVSGMTIAPVLDYYGRRPHAPAPAYVQYIDGQPWEWLTEDDLVYVPFRPQPDSPYGMAPLEAVLLTANTHMRFQKHYLDWFTEGNIPEGFATAPDSITTPDQLEEWEAYWDAMNTDARVKHKMKMMPHGTTLEFPQEKTFDPQFPLYLMRIVCAAYHVTPNDLGFTEDVNRATGDTQVDVQFRIGTLPLIRHLEDILTSYLQDDLGLSVVFEFDTGQETEDRVATAQADQIYIQNGVISVDEVREREYGLATDAERPTPRFIFSARQGPIPLRSLLDVAGPVDAQTAAPSSEAPLDLTPFSGTPGVLPDKAPGAPQFARAPTDPDEPRDPSAETPVPGSGVVGAPPAAPAPAVPEDDPAVVKELALWRANTMTRIGRGKTPRPFEPVVMDPDLVEAVWKQLRHVNTKAQADAVFNQIRKAMAPAPSKWDPLDPKGDMAAFGDVDASQASDLATQEDAELGQASYGTPGDMSDADAEDAELTQTELGPASGAVLTTAAAAGTVSTAKPEEDSGARIKPPSIRTELDEAAPSQTMDKRLVEYWAPRVEKALGGLIDADTIKDIANRAIDGARSGIGSLFERTATARSMDTSDLSETMGSLWSDAYGSGTIAGNVAIHGPGDDFTNWVPGSAPAPASTDLGWRAVLAASGQSIKGMTDTTLDGIGSAIDKGVADGLSVGQLVAHLSDYISDPKRAEMIAQTESARMLSTASMNTYRENGLFQCDIVVSDGACDECLTYADSNPYPTYGDVPVPVHPRCRCAIAPTEDAKVTMLADDPNKVIVDGETIDVIGADDKRGNARPVSRDEYALVAGEGKSILDGLRDNATPPTGLTDNLDAIKASTFEEVQKSWGGTTIDSHTGQALASDADKYAVTVKPAGLESVSVGENPTAEEWSQAMDTAMARFGDTLASQSHYLGTFHDDDLQRIDIDPVVVVDTKQQSEAIGAYTHNIGGAYNFADGNGYWPPYVDETVKKSVRDKIHFKGIGEWYAQNRRLNAGDTNHGLSPAHTPLDPITGKALPNPLAEAEADSE